MRMIQFCIILSLPKVVNAIAFHWILKGPLVQFDETEIDIPVI